MAVIAAAGALWGCGAQRAGETTGSWAGSSPFRAERLEAHPLTRVIRDDAGVARIEAHFELLDRFGVSVRELGEVEFEARAGGSDRSQAVWRRDLRTGDASAAQFDRITGMYGATLEVEASGGIPADGRLTLTIRFTTLDGRTLSAVWREGR